MSVTLEDWSAHSKMIETKDEMGVRCSAARHYYLAYHHAKSLTEAPMYGINGGVHEQLIQTLLHGFIGETNVNDYKKIAYKLRAAKTIRAKADYNLQDNFTSGELDLLIAYVEYIEGSVAKLKNVA